MSFPLPFQIEQKLPAYRPHRPDLRFGQHRFARRVEQVIHGLPFHFRSRSREHFSRFPTPVIALRVVEIVSTIHPCVAPVETRLVFVVTGAVLGQNALAIGGLDGVNKRPEISFGGLD